MKEFKGGIIMGILNEDKLNKKDIDKISKEDIVGIRKNTFGCEVMVSDRAKYENIGFVIDKTNN